MTKRRPVHHVRSVDANLTFRENLEVKARHKDGPVFHEQTTGARQSADGSWVDETHLVDRDVDRRLHHVESEDGTVLHHEDHPLSEHRGHGSDKLELRRPREAAKAAKAAERAARKTLRDAAWRAKKG